MSKTPPVCMNPLNPPPAPARGRRPVGRSRSSSSGLMGFFQNNPKYVLVAGTETKTCSGAVAGKSAKSGEPEVTSKPPSMKKGGMVKKTGLHYLHKGEMVVPVKDVKKVKQVLKK